MGLALVLSSGAASSLDLPFEQTKLANGLTLIVLEDHVLPQVATNIIYRVGSKDEQAGRTGFAHLFEHLMFMGTKRAPTEGVRRVDGVRRGQRTTPGRAGLHRLPRGRAPHRSCRCFSGSKPIASPSSAMRLTNQSSTLQRDVVRNERRQTSENPPTARSSSALPELMYPERTLTITR